MIIAKKNWVFLFFYLKFYGISYDNIIENDIFEVFNVDISAFKTNADSGNFAYGAQSDSTSGAISNTSTTNPVNKEAANPVTDVADDKAFKKPTKLAEVQQMTEAMNQFVSAMDVNIQFTIHEKTKRLMVQVVDQANHKVIKEFPSREFLDTMAAIRSYIGLLLDKKI